MKANILDILAFSTAFICALCWFLRWNRASRTAPYPPGPKGLPIIGNILDMPGKDEWEAARQWGEQYGDLVSVGIFGTRILFLNSYEAATDLLEKRGNIYSTRPRIPMAELEGWTNWLASVMPYGDELRKIRQLLHRFFQQSITNNYCSIQKRSTYNLLANLLVTPELFCEHVKYSAAKSIVMITYGFEVTENDPYIELVDKGTEAIIETPTFFIVNALPALLHLPTWFPGATFHKKAKEGYALSEAMLHEPYGKAKKLIANSTAVPSITSRLIDVNTIEDGSVLNESIIAKVVGVAYAGGVDTTVSVLLTFFLAMVLYPEAMRKGQEELDRVIGKDNLPTFEDRSKLPYVNAICDECLRWQTVGPLALPHCAEMDDVYNGYFIPAGATVFANVWAMLRNPKEFSKPDKFVPERWLVPEPPMHPSKVAFGFGRRICPGRHFAENSIFIGIASILAAFDITKAVDEFGVPITPVEDYTSSILRQPKPFKCNITPRSDEAATLIRTASSTSE